MSSGIAKKTNETVIQLREIIRMHSNGENP